MTGSAFAWALGYGAGAWATLELMYCGPARARRRNPAPMAVQFIGGALLVALWPLTWVAVLASLARGRH